MIVELNIDNWEDKDIIKNFLEMAFDGKDKPFILSWKTEDGCIISFAKDRDELLDELIKDRYEEMLMEYGEYAVYEDMERLLKAVEEGD